MWGVVSPAVPLAPGTVMTLTYGDEYYWPTNSRFGEALVPGTPIYAQVDAYNAGTMYGAVLETHERLGGSYNNIMGPVYSTYRLTGEQIVDQPGIVGRQNESLWNTLPPFPMR